MQAASDMLLGWLSVEGLDGERRDFYVRQLWDGKGSAEVDAMGPEALDDLRAALRLDASHAPTRGRATPSRSPPTSGKGEGFDRGHRRVRGGLRGPERGATTARWSTRRSRGGSRRPRASRSLGRGGLRRARAWSARRRGGGGWSGRRRRRAGPRTATRSSAPSAGRRRSSRRARPSSPGRGRPPRPPCGPASVETKLTSPSSRTPTCCSTLAEIRGSSLMLLENPVISPVMTTAPISAVPSEAPSCCAVYCRPPASPRSSSPTDDCTTLPSWETIRPMPTPSTAMAIANGTVSMSGSIVESSRAQRDEQQPEADADDRRGGKAPAPAATRPARSRTG